MRRLEELAQASRRVLGWGWAKKQTLGWVSEQVLERGQPPVGWVASGQEEGDQRQQLEAEQLEEEKRSKEKIE